MKRFEEQLHSKAQNIRLKAAEKRDLRERVVSYMEYHPVAKTAAPASVSIPAGTTRKVPTLVSFRSWYVKSFLGVGAAIVLLIVPVMAEQAVPGDMLYSVKVGLNEEVRSSIARSPYEKIEWETERLTRRLAEAQTLAEEGRLTEAQEEQVADAVRDHSEAARHSIERLRESDSDEAALAEITLSALFDVHSAVLSAHASNTETVSQRQNQIAIAIADSRTESEERGRTSSRPSYEGLLARIEVESNRAYSLFAKTAESATEEELSNMSRRLEDVDRKVKRGVAAYEAGEEREARTMLAEALSTTRKVITFMDNLEIRNSVVLEELVPVEYTTEELQTLLGEKHTSLEARYAHILDVLAADDVVEADVQEEVAPVLESIPDQLATATAALADESFEEAQSALKTAENQLDDIAVLIDVSQDSVPYTATSTASTSGGETASTTDEVGEDDESTATGTAATSSEATTTDQNN